jgi:GNAT superfamily N-acetyltransferase
VKPMVRALDAAAASEDVLDRVYEVMAACHAEVSPEAPYRSRDEAVAFLRHPPGSETREYWIAESEGEGVGFGQLAVGSALPTARIEILVHPDRRRAGHGTALLDAVQRQAAAHGARVLIGSHATESGSRFAAAVGAIDTQREVHSVLRLPLAVALVPVPGYRLRSWVGATPDELLDSFARAREAINDAPFPSDEEVAVWDGARVRDLEAALERRDREVRVTVALDERTEVVAFTELRVSRTAGANATTEDTAVVRKHRRQGLGRWVKVESLRRLQAERRDVTQVATMNAEENRAMRGLNEALGFRPVAVWTSCVLEISEG